MNDSKDKIITGILLVGVLAFFYMQASSGTMSTTGSTRVFSLEESQQMYLELGGTAGTKPVTMFTTSWCGVCRGLEKALNAQGIQYLSVDVEKSRPAMLYYQRAVQGKSSAVPVTVIGPDVVMGYNTSAIARSYAKL